MFQGRKEKQKGQIKLYGYVQIIPATKAGKFCGKL
jgi:hypothetical protein